MLNLWVIPVGAPLHSLPSVGEGAWIIENVVSAP